MNDPLSVHSEIDSWIWREKEARRKIETDEQLSRGLVKKCTLHNFLEGNFVELQKIFEGIFNLELGDVDKTFRASLVHFAR